MNNSFGFRLPAARRLVLAMVAAVAIMVPLVAAPAPANAAATVNTRVANFAAGPAAVTKGKVITVSGLAQKTVGKQWAKPGVVTATVYFDPDGSAPNKAVRTFKGNSAGQLGTTFTASVSGKWSIRLVAQGSLKASASAQKYVKVVAAPKPTSSKPASKWNCPAWAPIKGNAPRKIYHMKGQRFYNKTTPEICFSTEAAARAAGYRKSKV
ncbi:MAG: hypothetical protein WBX27_10110 [Specibacter sp.]